jgi:hypothetical protein
MNTDPTKPRRPRGRPRGRTMTRRVNLYIHPTLWAAVVKWGLRNSTISHGDSVRRLLQKALDQAER